MRYFLLCSVLILISSCGKPAVRVELPKDFDLSKLTFKQYEKYCGPDNLFNKQNFKIIKDTKIVWDGTVYSVVKDDSSTSYADKIIKIKMKKSTSVLSDLTLRMPNDALKKIEKLQSGDLVKFWGRIAYIGSKLNDHVIVVDKYKFVRPKSKK
jgi:hypothetical protein